MDLDRLHAEIDAAFAGFTGPVIVDTWKAIRLALAEGKARVAEIESRLSLPPYAIAPKQSTGLLRPASVSSDPER